ncbi:hypothetical protein ABPG75_000076 [Micractinium tetrahymenae]
MGRDKKEKGCGARHEGGDSGDSALGAASSAAALAYASQQCGLCRQAVETETEEHIAGFCTACKKIPLHSHCVVDYLERVLKAEAKEGGHTSKGLKAVLLLATGRPQELIATNGRMPKWQCLRKCCACQDGEMVTAEVQKARKVPPAPPPAAKPAPKATLPPKPAPAAKKPAPAPRQQQASSGFVVQRREPVATAPSAATRLHGSSSASTFAAEQERLAREEKERQRQERLAVKAARKHAQEQAQAEAQEQDQGRSEQVVLSGRVSSAAEGEGSSDESSVWWPPAQAQLPSATASSLGAATPQLSHAPSVASSLTPDDALTSFSLGAAVAAWSSSDAGVAPWNGSEAGRPAWGGSEGGAPGWAAAGEAYAEGPAAAFDAAAAAEPESLFWLPPQFDREGPPEAEVDELMKMMGLG